MFIPELQNRLLNDEKLMYYGTWEAFAKHLGVSAGTIARWRNEKVPLPLNVYRKLNFYEEYKRFILDYKMEFWNLRKGDDLSLPEYSEELAELIGIVLGDGYIEYRNCGPKIKKYSIKIAGDSIQSYNYMNQYIPQLIKDLFNVEVISYKSKDSNCIYVALNGKQVIEFFGKMGLKPGNKLVSQNTIPDWVWKDEEYLKACIRGLYDTDGSVYEMLPHWPGLFQVYFGNKNLTLLRDVRKALIQLGFVVSKLSNVKKNRCPCFYISRKDQVFKFYKEIGFNNEKHIRRISKFLKNQKH
tara:strand:- start:188 stop:1081 length:894 start_codon:yes stop_codon:yes gene_type:complete